ncbi:MAG: dienelactone hydrolase family protein [Acidobacteriota bacterium]|nr:dienelactone hydrolase family protein [Acidobacteriota bacterium]
MGEWTTLKTQDDHELGAYVATPDGKPIGALVVVQEIFGVNPHIRSVADSYARDGFLCVAPALFDRIERDLQLSYSPEDMKKAFALYPQLKPDLSLLDVAAAFERAKKLSGTDCGVLGFCYGGLVTWLSATRGDTLDMQPACCVGYYAGGIGNVAAEQPSCPVLLHFGADDTHIGHDQVSAVQSAHPEVEVFVYAGAGHAFNRDADPHAFHAPSATLARERTLAFLKQNLA